MLTQRGRLHRLSVNLAAARSSGLPRRPETRHAQQANRKYQHASALADAALAAGNVGLDANGDVIYSQTLDLEVDLGMIDLHSRS
jgi:hypothetical protein